MIDTFFAANTLNDHRVAFVIPIIKQVILCIAYDSSGIDLKWFFRSYSLEYSSEHDPLIHHHFCRFPIPQNVCIILSLAYDKFFSDLPKKKQTKKCAIQSSNPTSGSYWVVLPKVHCSLNIKKNKRLWVDFERLVS